MRKKINNFFQSSRRNKIISVLTVLVVIAAGYLILQVGAAGFFAVVEPDAGTLSGGAKVVSDASAAGGKAVQFTPPTTPTPDPTPTPAPTPGTCNGAQHTAGGPDGKGGCWPGTANTGIPAGTTLTNYTGPCTITSNTVIDSKNITCDLEIRGSANVTIRKSKVTALLVTPDNPGSHFLTIEDSELNGTSSNRATVSYTNFKIVRSNLRGAQHNINCVANCEIRDSYLHDPYVQGGTHNNTFISNGGNNMTLVHNTLACTVPNNNQGGGCSSSLSLFGDFSPITNVTADGNLFVAGGGASYCAYGGSSGDNGSKPYGHLASNVIYRNNIFQKGASGKCASAGPITDFNPSRPGNLWQNNKWDDGGTVNP
jgi:hypothetical protein